MISYNIKHIPMTPNFIPSIYPGKMKTCSKRNLYTNVHSSFIHSSKNWKQGQEINYGINNKTLLSKKKEQKTYATTKPWIANSILSFWYLLKCHHPKEAFPGYPNLMSLLTITLQHLIFCYGLKINHNTNYLISLCCITPLKCKLHEGKRPFLPCSASKSVQN